MNMKILEYDDVDPLQVLHLTMLALDFPFTPEHAAHLRNTDPHPFPCLTVNAVDHDRVVGQVGVFRLPMVSITGREDVGGVWAVSTHPLFTDRGIATTLLDEAHTRMRDKGLRFSTLATDRYRVAYKIYKNLGYEDLNIYAKAMTNWETAHQPTRLRAYPVGKRGYDYIEELYASIAKDYLGFAWRHTPFTRLRRVELTDIWILSDNELPVGYALTYTNGSIINITNLVLKPGINASEAVAAVCSEIKSTFVQVSINRPVDVKSLRSAGYQVAHPSWGAFMLKPLTPEVSIKEAKHLFGIGSDRFMISWLDVT